jgi:hypothetical protein
MKTELEKRKIKIDEGNILNNKEKIEKKNILFYFKSLFTINYFYFLFFIY